MNDLVSLNSHCASRAEADLGSLLAANIAALEEGTAVLSSLSDEQYSASCLPAFKSTLGAHYRHLLEHYICFLAVMDAEGDTICYDLRRRDAEIERNRSHALGIAAQLNAQLCNFSSDKIQRSDILVREQEKLAPVKSTVARELLFLLSHTVHHHAMIAAMCRILGRPVPENFGVAIATQSFLAASQACEPQPRGQIARRQTEVTG